MLTDEEKLQKEKFLAFLCCYMDVGYVNFF